MISLFQYDGAKDLDFYYFIINRFCYELKNKIITPSEDRCFEYGMVTFSD